MNSLIRRVGLLQLTSQNTTCLPPRSYHWTRGNVNVYKRLPKQKILHFKKAELLSVLKPYRRDPNEGKPMWETCEKVVNPKKEEIPLTAYEIFLCSDLLQRLEKSEFLAVVQRNPLSKIEQKRCIVYLGREKMTPALYSKRVLNATLTGTQYENLKHLFDGQSHFIFCEKPTMKELLKILKKYPQYVILAGFYEGRILTRANIEEYANLPSLDIARAQFASVLDLASTQLLTTLGASQSLLVSHLESLAGELKKDCAPASSSTETEQGITSSEETKS